MVAEDRRGDPQAYVEHMAGQMGRTGKLVHHSAAFLRGPDGEEHHIVTCVMDLEPLSASLGGRRSMREQRVGLFRDGHEMYSGVVATGWEQS